MINKIMGTLCLFFVLILPFISYKSFKIESTSQSKNAYFFWRMLFIISIIMLGSLLIPILIYFVISS